MAINNALNSKVAGFQVLLSTGVINGRTLTGTTNQFTWTNGNGASAGDATLGFASVAKMTTTQPMVVASNNATVNNVTGDGTAYTVIFNTETTDAGSNYNNATGIFTAPITGNYLIHGNVGITGLGTTVSFTSYIVSTPATLPCTSNALVNTGLAGFIWCPFKATIRLATSDTVKIQVIGAGGTLTNDIYGAAGFHTWLSINLAN